MQKNRKMSRLSSLEFETAAWVLHYWGVAIADPETTAKRRKELNDKLQAVKTALQSGLSADAEWPNEIIADEFHLVGEVVNNLWSEIRGKKTIRSRLSI